MEKTGSKKQNNLKVKYADGFVIAINKKNLPAYKKMALLGRKIWIEHGALDYKECVADDLDTEWGLPFATLTSLKKNEMVIFSWIGYSSKSHRDKVNAKVMADPRMIKSMETKKMPFEMKRMSYGGFKVFVSN